MIAKFVCIAIVVAALCCAIPFAPNLATFILYPIGETVEHFTP